MKNYAMIKQFFLNLPGVKDNDNIKAGVEAAWRRGIISAKVMDVNSLEVIRNIFDTNSINYFKKQSKIPEFSLFAFSVDELTPEKIAYLQAAYGYEQEQVMGR